MLNFTKISWVIVIFCILSTGESIAQSFKQGNVVLSGGYGLGNLSRAILNTYNDETNYSSKGRGPFFAKFEYAISDHVGLGLNYAHVGVDAKWDINYGSNENYKANLKWRNSSVLARVNVHFMEHEQLDLYWGTGLGYRFGQFTYKDNDPSRDDISFPSVIPVGFETTFGIRYFFIPNLGAYAEVGIAKAPIQFGLAGKF
jgi:hypothetical protein